MVKTVKSHYEEDEEDDDEFSSRTPDGFSQKEGKSSDGKANVVRSKHSETEQRRRSKINERFQILRDLIPENDQKRDKASLLLEVIQYIQFLQEKLQMYEETYQGWSVEPSKLMPRRGTSGPVEGFLEQSDLIKNGYTREDCIGIDPTLLASAQNSAETELSVTALYKATEDPHMAANETVPFNMPLQPILFENVTVQPLGGSFEAEHFSSQSQSLYLSGKRDTTESVVPCYIGQEELKVDSGEAGISNMYSQRLLNTLNRTLASLGVDMSQANLRVQLNVGKHTNSGAAATTQSSGKDYDYSHKRLRTEQR